MAAGNAIKKELLDELLQGRDPKALFDKDGLLDDLKKALAERALNAELDHHLDQDAEQAAGNHRNGTSPKTVLTDTGKLTLAIPRDRQGSFEPQLIEKYQRRFPGFDQKIVALYARGMSTRDIQEPLPLLWRNALFSVWNSLGCRLPKTTLEETVVWHKGDIALVLTCLGIEEMSSNRSVGNSALAYPSIRRSIIVT